MCEQVQLQTTLFLLDDSLTLTIILQGHSKDKVVYSKFTDLLPKEVYGENDDELARPDEEAVKDATEATRAALEKLTSSKITAAMPVRAAEKQAPAQYIR